MDHPPERRGCLFITLALDLLQDQGDLPEEVVVVHTYRERPETAAALARLQADLPLTYPQVLYRSLELQTEAGPLRDVTAPHEVDVAFRALYAEVRAAKLAHLPIKLLIIGNGGDKNALIKLAEELGLSERVIFQEPVPHTELPAWYATSDIGVFPSIAELSPAPLSIARTRSR